MRAVSNVTAWDIKFPGRLAALAILMTAMLAAPDGFSAAAGDKTADAASDATAKSPGTAPIVLAGRWSGPRHGYAMRRPVGGQDSKSDDSGCKGNQCTLTYDIVACPDGWCGIAVSDATPCGAIGVRMKPDTGPNRRNAFAGKLELAKGSAPYTVEAWYSAPGSTAGEGRELARLHFVGDTGDGGMLMMRRSFPFQAELTRISDAKCTLEQATS